MKELSAITFEERLEVANILGGCDHISDDSKCAQVKEVLGKMHNGVTNIPGMSWYRAFKYLESLGYEIK